MEEDGSSDEEVAAVTVATVGFAVPAIRDSSSRRMEFVMGMI